jgi:hypothetical protein
VGQAGVSNATIVASSCQRLKLSSPYEKHFSVVRTAAKELGDAVNRQPFDLVLAQDKPIQLDMALSQVEASLAKDPAADANYISRSRQLYELYGNLMAFGYRVLRSKASGDQRQIGYWVPIFRQAAQNTEAGYYDNWKSVRLQSLHDLDQQAHVLEYSARAEYLAGHRAGAVAPQAAPAAERSACQAGPLSDVTGVLKDASYGNGGGSFILQPSAGPSVEFNVGNPMGGDLPLFDHQVSEWDTAVPSDDQKGTNFIVRYRAVTCSGRKPTYDKQISSIEKR